MSKWLPIESAPMDGSDIIIGWGIVVIPAWYCGLPGEDCWYEYGKGPADGRDEFGIEPSTPQFWQPLPEPTND